MKTRVGMLALLAILTSCGSSSASSVSSESGRASGPAHSASQSTTTDAPRPACGPSSATTLASVSQARVYSVGQGVYGCAASGGRTFRLGETMRSLREGRAGPIALADTVAAYGFTRFGVDTVSTEVVVRRLTDGAQLTDLPASRAVAAESFQSVGSIVVGPDGTVAWIGSDTSILAHRARLEVHVARGSSDSVLDSGSEIAPDSLRLRGSTLSWRDGRVTRHGKLR